jgi:pyridoxal phosphate enzyme (YggS family)
MIDDGSELKRNLESVLTAIAGAARQSGRSSDAIRLMAVSKTQSLEAIVELASHGQVLFGENRVQEAVAKFSPKPTPMEVHLIGHLQSNKVRKAVAVVDSIDSVDSLRVARLIGEEALRIGKTMPVLLEVNTSGEASKSGFANERDYWEFLDNVGSIPALLVRGLMTIGPMVDDERTVRSAFASLRSLAERSALHHPELDFSVLSMGMSQDFKAAIAEGSTMVRIGTALFGRRSP